MDLVGDLKYAQHEKRDVLTSIIVLGEETEPTELGEKGAGPEPGLTIMDKREVVALAGYLADGFNGAVVVKSNGQVIGNYNFKSEYTSQDRFLPKRYRKAANTSRDTRSLLFLFGGNGRVSVFYGGQLILSHRNGKWHAHTNNREQLIKYLSRSHSTNESVIREVLRIALRISDECSGALITVGDHKGVLKISDPPKTAHLNLPKMNLGDTSDEVITGLMSQDGATIFTSNGSFIGAMTYLRPPPETQGEEEVGRGTKHSTAAKVSAATKAFCVAVSIDGRITFYSRGEKCWIDWI